MNKKMLTILLSGISIFSASLLFAQDVKSEAKSAEKKQAVKIKYQTLCPVMGGKINKKLFVDFKGKRIYVCCPGCLETLKKNPEKYIKKLEKEGVTLETVKVEKTKVEKTKVEKDKVEKDKVENVKTTTTKESKI